MAEKFSITRLDNGNYGTWKIGMKSLLISADLENIKEPRPESLTGVWSKTDEKEITLCVEDTQLSIVEDASFAFNVWERLKKYHEKATVTRVTLLKKLSSLNYEKGTDI